MKRITILAATLFALSGLQAQTGIDGVLRNIETNNKELQANAQLIASQKLEARTEIICLTLPFRMPICGTTKIRIIRSVSL